MAAEWGWATASMGGWWQWPTAARKLMRDCKCALRMIRLWGWFAMRMPDMIWRKKRRESADWICRVCDESGFGDQGDFSACDSERGRAKAGLRDARIDSCGLGGAGDCGRRDCVGGQRERLDGRSGGDGGRRRSRGGPGAR